MESMTLLRRCQSGEPAALEALYDEYYPALFRLAYSMLVQADEAEDAAQDALIHAFNEGSQYKRNSAHVEVNFGAGALRNYGI